MKRYLYIMTFAILILNIISALLSYIWLNPIFYFTINTITYVNFAIFMVLLGIKNTLWKEFYANVSVKHLLITYICVMYTFFSFLYNFCLLTHGTPELVKGFYYQNDRGFYKEITRNRYIALSLAEQRLRGCCTLMFSAIPWIFQLTIHQKR